MSKYVTVYRHRGYEICTMSPATPDQLGYIIDHAAFADDTFNLVQDAIDAIDAREMRGAQASGDHA